MNYEIIILNVSKTWTRPFLVCVCVCVDVQSEVAGGIPAWVEAAGSGGLPVWLPPAPICLLLSAWSTPEASAL